MQDIHAIGGDGGGRFLGGGDRRLRPHNHPNHHQALKCPRCDSLNTKFCYYNNYNLSQPRHFCKSCRRYWTKGGVLRNVPVGGGCRKTKRAAAKPKSSAGDAPMREGAHCSSSESSAAAAAGPTSEEISAVPPSTNSAVVYNFHDSRFFNENPNFDHRQASTDGQIGSLMTSSSEDAMGFGMANIYQAPVEDMNSRMVGTTTDHVDDDFKMTGSVGMSNDGLAAALDWGDAGGDQGLFDLTAAVDPAYWSQTQWDSYSSIP